jgi:hypothetical protein
MSVHSAYLRKAGFAAVLAAGVFGLAAPASADVSQLVGNWVNQDHDTSGITRVIVTHAGPNRVRVRVFGQCHPTDCNWGQVMGHSYFEGAGSNRVKAVMARFNAGFATKIVILRDVAGPRLNYEVLTDFTDGSGRRDYDVVGRLHRAAAMPHPSPGPGPMPVPSEDCVTFNPGTTHVAHVGGEWKIVDGSHWIASFGAHHAEANRAMHIINHYHFNRQCFVGRPNPSMTYWKRGAHIVPSNSMGGQDCVGFNPATTHVAHVGGEWKIVDGSHWIASFGSKHAEANEAIALIHHYHMNRQCFVGRPHPSMTYWLSQ